MSLNWLRDPDGSCHHVKVTSKASERPRVWRFTTVRKEYVCVCVYVYTQEQQTKYSIVGRITKEPLRTIHISKRHQVRNCLKRP